MSSWAFVILKLLQDATALDVWVLDHLRTLFHNASTDDTLNSVMRQEKTVFFLHLLGLDTTGHSYRPHSKVTILFYLCGIDGAQTRLLPGIYDEY